MKFKTMARKLIVDALSNITPSHEDGPYVGLDKNLTDGQLHKLVEALAVERARIVSRFGDIEL